MATIPQKDNHLIQVFCYEGSLDKAINVLFHMNTTPSTDTYLSLLKACNKNRALSQAKQVNVHLTKHIPRLSGYLGDYLVMTLARCGAVEDALKISWALPRRTVFSWTAMISAYAERGQGWEALKLYESMKEDGVRPNHYTFVALLKACGRIGDLDKVRTLHLDSLRMGLGADVYIATTLIRVYGRCGTIEEAEDVFSSLLKRDVVTWNAMLAAYIDQGLESKALQLFRQVYEERVRLDELMFVSALQACVIFAEKERGLRKSMPLEVGMALHADAQRAGFCLRPFMLTTLVNMYSKFGSIESAEGLISAAFSQCNNVTWNAMIAAYFEHDQERRCLQLYHHMHEQGLSIDQHTLASALQACGALAEKEEGLDLDGESLKLMSLELVRALHFDAQRLNILSDIFVCNTLIRIYGKCRAIMDAESLFCELLDRDIVSWNSLLSAYVEHCQAEKALLLYKQMREDMVSPGQLIFVMVLQACGQLAEKEEWTVVETEQIKLMSLNLGLELHIDVREGNFAADIVVGDSLLRMYTKCGTLVHAEDVFAALRVQHDVRFWTAMLSAYVDHEHEAEALQLYMEMYKEGLSPDQHTFVIAVQACSIFAEKEVAISSNGHVIKAMPLEIGTAIHADARRLCYGPDIFINNTLISMYGKCGALAQAEDLFVRIAHPDEVSWNALLSAYSAYDGRGEEILQLYRQMQLEGRSGCQLTFVIALQACCNLLEASTAVDDDKDGKAYVLEIGQALHSDAQKSGFSSDVTINNCLLRMYGKFGNLQEAEAVFGAMHQHDGVSWTVLLSIYVEQGELEMVVALWSQMQAESILLDEVSLICIMRACISIVSLELCRQHHFTVSSYGLDLTPSLAVTLIHTYGNCASMGDAQAAFNQLNKPDIPSWNACIASHAGEGNCEATMTSFEELGLAGNEPSEASFASALNACAHAGLIPLGLENFDHMKGASSLNPGLTHYSILADLLGRAGCFSRVESMLEKMPMQPDVTMWVNLLGCCRTHGNVELGERAFNGAVSLRVRHSAAYVMLSNLYIEAGLLDFERKLRSCTQ